MMERSATRKRPMLNNEIVRGALARIHFSFLFSSSSTASTPFRSLILFFKRVEGVYTYNMTMEEDKEHAITRSPRKQDHRGGPHRLVLHCHYRMEIEWIPVSDFL